MQIANHNYKSYENMKRVDFFYIMKICLTPVIFQTKLIKIA